MKQRLSHNPLRRKAFTMIELLVVIGIIVILISIVFVGMKYIGVTTKTSSERVNLQNLSSMLAELEQAGPLSTTLASGPISQNTVLNAPGDVTDSTYAQGTIKDRWLSAAVVNTQFVMGKMRSVPKNREAIQALPAERFMKAQNDANAPVYSPPINTKPINPHGTPDPPIPVDAWGNPVIFVPGAGLNVVSIYVSGASYKKGAVVSSGPQTYRSLKGGDALVSDTSQWELLANGFPLVKAPGNRPFFASAGPDGDFQSPDDNVYSFE